jgi:NitT/TauT family transport system permease protein
VRVAIIGGFLLLWEIASGRWIEPFLISSPSRIFSSMISGFHSGDLLQHTWVTFLEIAIGYPLGAISGIALGYCFGRSRLLAEVFEPIIIALNGIPRTAVAPLFIVWLGIGLWSKVGVVFLLTFFLNFFNTYTGMRQMDREYIDLANLMGVRGWKLSYKVIFPAISPYVFTGIRTSIPFAVIGAIVGEFIAATFFHPHVGGNLQDRRRLRGYYRAHDHGDHHGPSCRIDRAQSTALAESNGTRAHSRIKREGRTSNGKANDIRRRHCRFGHPRALARGGAAGKCPTKRISRSLHDDSGAELRFRRHLGCRAT